MFVILSIGFRINGYIYSSSTLLSLKIQRSNSSKLIVEFVKTHCRILLLTKKRAYYPLKCVDNKTKYVLLSTTYIIWLLKESSEVKTPVIKKTQYQIII